MIVSFDHHESNDIKGLFDRDVDYCDTTIGIHRQAGPKGGAMMGDLNRYVDLFKTYGIEYIIIIVFLIAIIFFWRYLSRRPKKKGKRR
jgi:hypothetical protein